MGEDSSGGWHGDRRFCSAIVRVPIGVLGFGGGERGSVGEGERGDFFWGLGGGDRFLKFAISRGVPMIEDVFDEEFLEPGFGDDGEGEG